MVASYVLNMSDMFVHLILIIFYFKQTHTKDQMLKTDIIFPQRWSRLTV